MLKDRSRPDSLPRRVARRIVVAMQRWTSRDYQPVFAAMADRAAAQERRSDQLEGWVRSKIEQLESSLNALIERVDLARREVAQLSARYAMEIEQLSVRGAAADIAVAAANKDLHGALAELRERQEGLSRIVSERSLTLNIVRRELDRLRQSGLPAPPVAADSFDAPDSDHRLDQLYLEFEDRARGTRADIKQRQSVYLPLVREIGAGTPDRPILDVGSGRGEWLEFLRGHGLQVRGVDMNRSMVSLCQTLGLDCIEGDAVAFLRALPSNTLGMISGFHIIEHLPFDVFIELLDESLRVLAPGGAVLFETPDPENVLVGSHTFYMDPSHRNPMPSAMVRIMAEARGLTQIEIRRLHPSSDAFRGEDRALIDQLNNMFFGPRDYALIARKP